MSDKKQAPLLDHEYDGIRELDNPLPGWWLATFYGAILFSVLYVGYYEFAGGPSSAQELAAEKKVMEAQRAAGGTEPALPEESELSAALASADLGAAGGKIFDLRCASCHGAKGEGQIGPNLTDKHWLHGDGSMLEIAKIVADGVPDKGMPPWKAMLKAGELATITAFVAKLQGTKPANAKAPQGVEIQGK